MDFKKKKMRNWGQTPISHLVNLDAINKPNINKKIEINPSISKLIGLYKTRTLPTVKPTIE